MYLPPLFFLNIENIHASKIRPHGGYDPAHLAAGKCNYTYNRCNYIFLLQDEPVPIR